MATKTEKANAENLAEESPGKTLVVKSVADSSSETATRAASIASSRPQSSPNGKGIFSTTVASEAENDARKKMLRAERFGISAMPYEQEKRKPLAESFMMMMIAVYDMPPRLGITRPSTADDDRAKKKARLAKFAPVSKIDPLEEEKRKARAIRFANPPTSSLSQANGKGDIEPVKLPDRPEWLLGSLVVGNFIV